MNEEQVKTLIGEDMWDKFIKFMRGQTVGLNDDGSFDYYDCDVSHFFDQQQIQYEQPSKEDPWRCKCGYFHVGFPYNCSISAKKDMKK